jgi:hypothetical protein
MVSPRASYYGAALIAQGIAMDKVYAYAVRKGMTPEQWDSIKG